MFATLLMSSSVRKMALGAAIVAALGVAYAAHRAQLLRAGEARAEARYAAAENERLAAALAEVARLNQEVERINHDYRKNLAAADALRERLRAADERLRDERAAFAGRVAAASAEALRRYAEVADDNLSRCRADVARFGEEAVRGSAAAHALKSELDARQPAAQAGSVD